MGLPSKSYLHVLLLKLEYCCKEVKHKNDPLDPTDLFFLNHPWENIHDIEILQNNAVDK